MNALSSANAVEVDSSETLNVGWAKWLKLGQALCRGPKAKQVKQVGRRAQQSKRKAQWQAIPVGVAFIKTEIQLVMGHPLCTMLPHTVTYKPRNDTSLALNRVWFTGV
jgi:hypothetical protein